MQPAASVLDRIKGWRPYVEAKLGFRNHWYPTLFSSEIEEGKPKTFKLLGENLLLNRVDGKVYCIRNRCLHRGVNFSSRLECFAKGTITCWYHGWTYRWEDGRGRRHPHQSRKLADRQAPHPDLPRSRRRRASLFVFFGDTAPPPLAHDVPPNFLDDDMAIFGQSRP